MGQSILMSPLYVPTTSELAQLTSDMPSRFTHGQRGASHVAFLSVLRHAHVPHLFQSQNSRLNANWSWQPLEEADFWTPSCVTLSQVTQLGGRRQGTALSPRPLICKMGITMVPGTQMLSRPVSWSP